VKGAEIRNKLLSDHAALRRALGQIEDSAGRVLDRDDDQLAPLRHEATGFLDALLTHLEWEDRHLDPPLRAAGDHGQELADELALDHAELRELMEHILRGVADESRPGRVIARNLLDLCGLLSDDMVGEEEILLDVAFPETACASPTSSTSV
jgi:hypothetical protein